MKREEGTSVEDRRRLYTAVIGDQSTDYYLEVFEEFDRNGKTSSIPNSGAAFGVGLWFFWRRLWLPGLFYLIYAAIVLVMIFHGVAEVLNMWRELGATAPNKAIGIFRFLGMLLLISLAFGAWLVKWETLIFIVLFAVASYPLAMANALYYRYCNRRIEKALTRYRKLEIAERSLIREEGVSYAGVAFGLVFLFSLVIMGWNRLH